MYRSPIILLTSYLRGVSPRIRFRHFHLASFRLPSALISDLLFSFRFLNYRFDLIEAFIRTSAKGKKDRLRVGERGMGTIDQIQINFQWLCFDPFVIPATFAEKIYIYTFVGRNLREQYVVRFKVRRIQRITNGVTIL